MASAIANWELTVVVQRLPFLLFHVLGHHRVRQSARADRPLPRAHKGRPQNCFLSYENSGSSTRERIPGNHGTIVLLSGCGR